MRVLIVILFALLLCLSVQELYAQTGSSSRGGGTQVVAQSLSNFGNGVSAAMGNTSLSALYNELSFVNNIAQLPLSNQRGGVGLSYTPWLPLVPVDHTKWFQMNMEGYYIFGENYYQPSTEKLAAIYECYQVGTSKLRDIRGRRLSIKKNGYVLRRQALSLKTSYYSRGLILGRDENNRNIGEVTPFEFAIALGYSVNLADNFSVGLALRYLQSTVYNPIEGQLSNITVFEELTTPSFSGDLYFLYDVGFKEHKKGGISIGLIIGKIGTKIDFGNGLLGYQPAYIGLGASFTNIYSSEHAFHYTFDFKKSLVHSLPSSELLTAENLKVYSSLSVEQSMAKSFENLNNFTLNAGAQYVYKETLFVRLGAEWEHTPFESIYRVSTGLGYAFKNRFNVDFAYWVPFGQSIFNLLHSFSLSASIEF